MGERARQVHLKTGNLLIVRANLFHRMPDHLKKHEYLADLDVTLELDYRLNFDAARSCGFVRVFKGDLDKIELDEGEEAYEIYMELFECGLSEEDVMKNYKKISDELKSGEIEI